MSGRSYSTVSFLLAIVLVALAPLAAFSGFLLYRISADEHARYERTSMQMAKQLMLVVDGELLAFASLLQGLASAASLSEDNLEAFYNDARRVTEGNDNIVVLRTFDAVQLINTERPYGSVLPPAVPLSEEERAAFQTQRAVVSNVYLSPLTREPRIAVAIPIRGAEDRVRYILALTAPVTRIRDRIVSASPEPWLVGVGDRNGSYVARSARHDEVAGQAGLPEYVAKVVGAAGSFTSVNFEGRTVLAGYYRSPLSGWFVAANIPLDVIDVPLRRSLLLLSGVGACALAVAIILASLIGRTIARGSRSLAEQSMALAEGRTVPESKLPMTEFRIVGAALRDASAAIQDREAARQKSEEQRQLLLRELDHRVKNSLAIALAVALQTCRESSSIPEVRTLLSQRLIALSHAHEVLTRENWTGAHIVDVLQMIQAPYGQARFKMDGPSCWLPAKLSLALSICVHELCTNAAKYGALSNSGGIIFISWNIKELDESRVLQLNWQERGGPPTSATNKQGFGSDLLNRIVESEGGGIRLMASEDGYEYELTLPIRGD